MNWDLYDYVAAAALLIATGLGVFLCLKLVKNPSSRWLAIGLVVAGIALIWIQLAVGLI